MDDIKNMVTDFKESIDEVNMGASVNGNLYWLMISMYQKITCMLI